jgi:UDP-GlcNAc:undecaprenyl-phosphate GlcNAc-1-phosphate transferase
LDLVVENVEMIRSLYFFGGSFLVALIVTALLIRYWKFSYGVDHPDSHRKQHGRPILRLGGIPIFGVFFVCMAGVPFYLDRAFHVWAPILLTSTLIFLLGLADDFKPIGARAKLLGQIVIAVIAYQMGLSITNFTYPVGNLSFALGAMGLVVTVIWFVAVPNIINLIDGVDGLAAGLGFLLYVMLGYVAWTSGSMEISLISFAVAGALMGFLCFNFPPAKIFLGDGGAYFIGFGIAALSLQCSQKGSVAAVLLVTVIALGLPIMDTVFALLRRGAQGFPVFRADAEHIHHRLRRLGFSERRLVLLMYFVTVFLSLMALSVFWTQGRTLPIALGVMFLMVLVSVRYLGYVWNWADLNLQIQKTIGRRESVRYVLAYARVAELELSKAETQQEFEVELKKILERCDFWLEPDPNTNRQDWQQIELHFPDRETWKLWHPVSKMNHNHHVRLAECFRDTYLNACRKWQQSQLFRQNNQ